VTPQIWRRISVPWNGIPGESGGLGKVSELMKDLVITRY
jgi:hypothetical protein